MSKQRKGRGTPFSPARSAFGTFATSTSRLAYVAEPPDFSAVGDANVVVSLKNLLKKDSTTKAKALEDLVAYAQAHPHDREGGVDDAVLEAWTQLYPRISIDNARRVRELAHGFQLALMRSGRKRMERRIPRVVGAWLAGTFDKDRVVARAAGDGLASFLPTDDKTAQFWRRCEPQILEYACDAMRETPDSLSDERTTTREDAEAKYYRVVGGSLSLVLGLVAQLDDAQKLDRFLDIDTVWALSAAHDALVRKTLYQLVRRCLQTWPDLVSSRLARIGRALVSDAFKVRQTGSAADLVGVLTVLTQHHPQVWGAKKSPLSRLQGFVERGSQGGSGVFWQELGRLFVVLPLESVSPDAAADFLKALRVGIASREEPRTNAPYAWSCYMQSFRRLLDLLSPSARPQFLAAAFYPLTEQYLFPTPEMASWAGGGQLDLVAQTWRDLASHADISVCQSVASEWQRLGQMLLSKMANALPEVSKEFQRSQQTVAGQGERWFALTSAITDNRQQSLEPTISAISTRIIQGAVDLLVKRNYKPFGAASLLQSALSIPRLFADGTALSALFQPESLPTLLASPSAPYLVSCVALMGAIPEQQPRHEAVWNALVQLMLQHDPLESPQLLAQLVSSDSAKPLARRHQPLQDFLVKQCLATARGEADNSLVDSVLAGGVMDDSHLASLASGLVELLGNFQYPQEPVLRSLELLVRNAPSLLDSELQVDLVAKLLSLAELSPQNVVQRAESLRTLLARNTDDQPVVGIIQENLDTATAEALDIDTLVQQTTALSSSAPVEQLFPNTNIWMEQLSLVLQDPPDLSLSLTSSLAGAYSLVVGARSSATSRLGRDRRGRSVPARMALYTSQVLASGLDLSALPAKLRVELLYLLGLVVERAADQITLDDGKLWQAVTDEVDDFVSSARRLLKNLLADPSLQDDLIELVLRQTADLTPLALYSAKALAGLLQSMAPESLASVGGRFADLGVTKAAPNTVLGAVAFLRGLGGGLASHKAVGRLCNGLVSDITGAFPTSPSTLVSMVLLNACLSVYESGQLPVDHRRQVFAVRQITSWLDTPDEVDARLAAEACRALGHLLPSIAGVYGPYWEQTVGYCIGLWKGAGRDQPAARLPYLHASLKLYAVLESLDADNDDLRDALSAHAREKSRALLEVLKMLGTETTHSQPSRIVDALLGRTAAQIPVGHVGDLSDLYGLVASESRDIQTAAFCLLHQTLPAAQEQLSLDVLLDKRDAHLPDELLSLLLDAPTLEAYPDDLLATFPSSVRSYLLAWHLIFDAYAAASFKVRADYTEQLKRTGSLPPLLDFAFDVLGHSAAHALSLDRERITPEHVQRYDVAAAEAESDERAMQWLLVHLLYASLKHVPGLFKGWFRDCRSKQTRVAVEAWTTRYLSPLLISETLDGVAEWAAEQPADSNDADDRELLVRVSKAAREVVAGYEVDELQAAIAIRVPAGYPLEAVSVAGVNRVAVDEKKWQSWLLATQGVITFSNGSIVDGLAAFRRNVVGALKGQSECAICYSVISADKKMPDKKCATCKNLFHRTCLYKWFQTSNQNTCPLCRNPIDYLGADKRRGGGGA